jgi:hypothetical protein
MRFNYGEHCFGSFVNVDGVCSETLDKKVLIKSIHAILEYVNESTLRDTLFSLLDNLDNLDGSVECISLDNCEQCGDYNREYCWEVD